MKDRFFDFVLSYIEVIIHLYGMLMIFGSSFFYSYILKMDFIFDIRYQFILLGLSCVLSEYYIVKYEIKKLKKDYFNSDEEA